MFQISIKICGGVFYLLSSLISLVVEVNELLNWVIKTSSIWSPITLTIANNIIIVYFKKKKKKLLLIQPKTKERPEKI